ncbi:hypothetical protein sscle_02g015940 [Sclerotinia sclerotiorum 1980 UF-70]|uniref:Rhodopsin domain-containing protein n=1 Tax=Sclerotinia sclerotiorum (strain ATCC 18683 / 1980 / Ss-1) TaxID=665079 RepID=A0A1D9PVT7_SCLS1|nr:hypothetical protein sscle_02g015940 [Sclerotinia sclerotiorum 1980 UF-70]
MEGIFVRQAIEGALPPPTGVTPNFVNPPSIAKYNVICQIVCMPVTTVFVCIRLYTRCFIHRKITGDDYACIVAWLGSLIYSGMALSLNQYGAGMHQWDVPAADIKKFGKLVYMTQMLYGPEVFATKVTILLLLSRVFGVKENMLWAVRVLIGFMALYYVPATIVKMFICWPVAHFWDPLAIKGSCLNENSIYLADCAMSIISDITILFLPISMIWRLKTRTMRKIGVSAVFGAGILACTASVLRLYETLHLGGTLDKTYGLVPILLWSIAEINIGIICGCLPILPSFIKKTFSAIPDSNDSTENGIYCRMERMSKPKRDIDDSIMQTQTRPEDSNERLPLGQSTIVQVNLGDNTWQGGGIMKMVEIDQRI